MAQKPDFDVEAAHKYFAAHCFNQAWDLIDKSTRTAEEDDRMIELSQASLWHWSQRKDCTKKNLSVGYWQASRVYALARQAGNARRCGKISLDNSKGEEPFFVAYAYEGLARAEMVAGSKDKMSEYLSEARRLAEEISDADSKKMILADLDTIK